MRSDSLLIVKKGAEVIDLLEAGAAHWITPFVWGAWTEAAAVMFERFHPPTPPPCACMIHATGRDEFPAHLIWPKTDERVRASHRNELNATEHGAYIIASATLGHLDGWRILARAHHGSGADLVMLPPGEENPEAFVRLEVSGIGAGVGTKARSALRARLRQKIEQLGEGDLDRPGIAAVVGFELATVLISEVQK